MRCAKSKKHLVWQDKWVNISFKKVCCSKEFSCVYLEALWGWIWSKQKHCGLGRHFGINKTLSLVKDKYYWPQMYKDIHKFVRIYGVCQVAKEVS